MQPPPQRAAPAPPPLRMAQGTLPPPVVRGQAPDAAAPPPPKPAPVAMPSPEQLGVAGRADGGCDWAAFHKKMQELGVSSFQMDRPNADSYQFTCMIPTGDTVRTHRIERVGRRRRKQFVAP